ncbi:ATP-binding protein [Pyrobaculum sp. 3827-6]|uniref:ATP-binding protein n=1 Tax=Pyrobaculum sp. 3827-6 TaxID=2983604 RepID=UPI0021DB4546|nr:ATP-binding protein [Pyrobaculum sp. 3827-6]MCU7787527.1 ATP-binding protein [Pyrobaculum sp. 3827-6]
MDCDYRVKFRGVGVCFADREVEVEWLLQKARRGVSTPIVLYGPEGCGKTTLLRYLRWRLSQTYDYMVYYSPPPMDLRRGWRRLAK